MHWSRGLSPFLISMYFLGILTGLKAEIRIWLKTNVWPYSSGWLFYLLGESRGEWEGKSQLICDIAAHGDIDWKILAQAGLIFSPPSSKVGAQQLQDDQTPASFTGWFRNERFIFIMLPTFFDLLLLTTSIDRFFNLRFLWPSQFSPPSSIKIVRSWSDVHVCMCVCV